MAAPFDTLKLARRFEAAGIENKQAGDMAEAIADAMSGADLVTKSDLDAAVNKLERQIDRVVNRLVAAMVIVAGLLFTALRLWPPH